jgi:uncharacterized coiled-coil protein SlyX
MLENRQERGILFKAIAISVREFVADHLRPLDDRLAALEGRVALNANANKHVSEVREEFRRQFQTLQDLLMENRKQLESHKRHLSNLEAKLKQLRGGNY